MSKNELFDDFAQTSAKAWKQQIQFDLKGADYNKTLVWDSPDGIKIKPFYHADDLDDTNQVNINLPENWNIGQTLFVTDAKIANTKALSLLHKGIDSMVFTIPRDTIAINELLNGIDLSKTKLYFDLRFLSNNYVQQLIAYVGKNLSNLYINIDIIGHLARTGNWYNSMAHDHEQLELLVNKYDGKNRFNLLSVDVTLYQNAGATRIQQLAYALAHANEYLINFSGKGLEKFESINFKMAVDSEHFFEIAKLRAMRLLFESLIAQKFGVHIKCHITTTPTKRNKTIYDRHVNLLRTTTESMSSIIGGANMVSNSAFDSLFRKDNDFSERLAKNQLLILKEESHLEKVFNVSNGSYYIEKLTNEMAQKALTLFKTIEASGGFLKHLKAHTIQRKIKESALKEQSLFNDDHKILVGTNKHINDLDRMNDQLELYPFVKTKTRKTLLEPIIEKRLAEDIEKKRLKEETVG